MKPLFTICIALISYFGLAQEIIIEDEDTKPSILLATKNYKGFDAIYNNLQTISENINETTLTLMCIDEIRQGQLLINVANIGRSFDDLKIDTRPSLNLELQRVMFTGNFFNTQQRIPLIIRQ